MKNNERKHNVLCVVLYRLACYGVVLDQPTVYEHAMVCKKPMGFIDAGDSNFNAGLFWVEVRVQRSWGLRMGRKVFSIFAILSNVSAYDILSLRRIDVHT